MMNDGWLGVYIMMSLVTLADEEGVVRYDDRALMRLLGLEGQVEFEEFIHKISDLCEPDECSNLQSHEGRRIIPLFKMEEFQGDRGYWIVNYDYYKKKGSREDRTIQQTARKRRQRDREKVNKNNDVTQGHALSTDSHAKTAYIDIDIDKDIKKKGRFAPPSLEEVTDYCAERKNGIDPESFINHYEANGWMRGKTKIKDWKACVRTWEKNTKTEPDIFMGAE